MSKVYFHTADGTAELAGSERAWLNHLADGPAMAAWDVHAGDFDQACRIMDMVTGDHYLVDLHTQAVAEDKANRAAIEREPRSLHAVTTYDAQRDLINALCTALHIASMSGLALEVAGVKLPVDGLNLNTALVAGSSPIQLAAKIHGCCEIHGWVEGPLRAWMAEIIDIGLRTGLYRHKLAYQGLGLVEQGWGQVLDLLRAADDGPVAMSYSVCDSFPNPWVDPDQPELVDVERWEDRTEDEQNLITAYSDEWYERAQDGSRFGPCVDWLRTNRPWAEISPTTLSGVMFSTPVTIYDLFAADRDERVRRAAGIVST